jgi:hypothetical protein
LFFPWLAGRFHNFELTQNREKNKKWPYIDCKYNGSQFPISSILTLFFPIEWVSVPVPMGRKKTLDIYTGEIFKKNFKSSSIHYHLNKNN